MIGRLRELGLLVREGLRVRRATRLARAAARLRDRPGGPPIVAVTGAAGKSTTVHLLAHLLGGPPAVATSVSSNAAQDVFRGYLEAGRSAAFVCEVSEFPAQTLARVAAALRPDLAVLTISGLDHHKAFRTRAAVAAELATLARGTPASGLVLANADDDELIRAITGAPPRVVTFGAAATADYRVTNVTVGADLALSCTCLHGGTAVPLVTRLVGRHQHVAVLAAVAAAHLRGVPWHAIAARVASFEPVFGRCSLMAVPGGATFICDTMKAPAWSCETSLAVLDDCPSAPRRTLVFGTLSDYAGDSRRAYRRLLQQARGRTDRVIFLRQTPSHVGATAEDQATGRVLFFPDVAAIADHLGRTALPGEVILVKGSARADHLERVALAAVAPVACRVAKCGRGRPCVECDLLGGGTRAAWSGPGIRRRLAG